MNVRELGPGVDLASARGRSGRAEADGASSPFVLPEPARPAPHATTPRAPREDAREPRRNEAAREEPVGAREDDARTGPHATRDGTATRDGHAPVAAAQPRRVASARSTAGDDGSRSGAPEAPSTGASKLPGTDDLPATTEAAAAAHAGSDMTTHPVLPSAAHAADADLPTNMLALLGAAMPAQGAGGPPVPAGHGTPPSLPGSAARAPTGHTIALSAVAMQAPVDAMAAVAPAIPGMAGIPPAAIASAPPAPLQVTPGVPGPAAPTAPTAMPLDGLAALAALAGDAARSSSTGELPAVESSLALATGDTADAASTPGSTPLFAVAPTVRAAEPTTATAAPVAGTVALPATPDDGFDDSFGQRIVWMAEQRITQAEMRVSPEGVGAIDIRLQLDGHRLSAQFTAAHADVRQALEAGMGRLRDMLGQHGMELADAQVGQQSQRDRPTPPSRDPAALDAVDGHEPVTTIRALRSRGLLDVYA